MKVETRVSGTRLITSFNICMNTKNIFILLMDFFSDLLLHILLWLELLFCLPQFYLLFLWERREFKFERWFFFFPSITQVPPHDFLFSSSILTSERLPFGAIMLKNLYYFGCNTSVLIDSTRRRRTGC